MTPADALREVLAAFHKVTNPSRDDTFGYVAPHPVHPDDYHRWQAALDQPDTCDASTVMDLGLSDGGATFGPCVLRHDHDGPVHKDVDGAKWWPEQQPVDDGKLMVRVIGWSEEGPGWSPFSVTEADVPAALRGPNCPRPPDDPEPLRRLAADALAAQRAPGLDVVNHFYDQLNRIAEATTEVRPVSRDARAEDPAYDGITGYRTWAEVEADPPQFTGLISTATEQCRAEFHHPTMQSARCDLPKDHTEVMHREQPGPTRTAFRWDNSVAMYPTDTTTEN